MARSGKRRGSRARWIVPLAVLVALGALFGVWQLTRPAPAKATLYDDVTVARSSQTLTVALSGTISPVDQSNATFKVPGTVTAVDVKVGDKVAKGAPLASVDDRDLNDAVALAQANVSAAKAQQTTVEDNANATDAQLAAAKAQVRSAEASLTNAQNRLADATLTSPIAGTVAKVGYSVGDQVSGSSAGSLAGSTGSGAGLSGLGGLTGLGGALPAGSSGSIVVIASEAWKLTASVGTADLPSIKAGQEATITPTGTTTTVRGQVDTVGIVADQNAGASATFPVTLRVTDTGAQLFSGSSADAVVTVGTFPDVLTVPVAAVTTDAGKSTVRLVNGTEGVPTAVTLGRRFGSVVEITSGVKEGDHIQVPKAQVIAKPTQPMYGPNGQYASPATASASPAK